jgi:ribosomal protein L10
VNEFPRIFIVQVHNLRTAHVQAFREAFRARGRLVLARQTVMRRALGLHPEDAVLEGIEKLSEVCALACQGGRPNGASIPL